jgi:effector-binding domain-containing protein
VRQVIDDYRIKEIEAVDVIGLELVTSAESIASDATTALNRIYEGLEQDDIPVGGPSRLVYHEMDMDSWTIELCVPVVGHSNPPDGLSRRRFEGGRAATVLHVGPYDQLGPAYRKLEAWIQQQSMEPAGPPFDVYLNDPNEVNDPAKFETEIIWPVN